MEDRGDSTGSGANGHRSNRTSSSSASKEKKSWRTPAAFLRTLVQEFTGKFAVLLAVNYFFTKGFGYNAANSAELPLYKHIGVGVEQYQQYYNVGQVGWAIKPLMGALSDARPIFGFHKRYYLIIAGVMGALSFLLLQAMHKTSGDASVMAPGVASCYFFGMTSMAMLDLLCEGCYTKMMAARPKTGSTVVTWVWFWYNTAYIVSSAVEGPMADNVDPFYILLTCVPGFFILVPLAYKGWLPEVPFGRGQEAQAALVVEEAKEEVINEGQLIYENNEEAVEMRTPLTQTDRTTNWPSNSEEKLMKAGGGVVLNTATAHLAGDLAESPDQGADTHHTTAGTSCVYRAFPASTLWAPEQRRVVLAGLVNGSVALGMAMVNIAATSKIIIGVYLCFATITVLTASFKFLPRPAFKVMAFLFTKEILYMHIRPTLDYWYTADEQCVPGGPHFSYTYYQTFGNIMASVASLIATIAFEVILSKRRYRTVFYITTLLRMTGALFDLVLVERWNVSLGIPDKVTWIFGDQFIYQAAYMLDFMPAVVLMSSVCPKGVEATMFAVLAGMSNFGQSISYSLGELLAAVLGIRTPSGAQEQSASGSLAAGDGCHFEALPTVVVMVHLLTPFLTIPLIWATIPEGKISKGDGEDDAGDVNTIKKMSTQQEEHQRAASQDSLKGGIEQSLLGEAKVAADIE